MRRSHIAGQYQGAFNISDTIESLLTVFRSQMEFKGLALNAGIAKLEHENVVGDEQHLQQIFMNIMGNAVKFTPSGGKISIHIVEKPSSDLMGHSDMVTTERNYILSYRDNYNALLGYMHKGLDFRLRN